MLFRSVLIPSGLTKIPADKEARRKQDEEHYKEAAKAYAEAQDEYSKSIPFIPQEFCDEYMGLLKLCSLQIYDFERRWTVSYLASQEERETLGLDSYERTDKINKKFDELNGKIRDYLACLDVL